MGFRDLRAFNQALMARQAWQLISFPSSLMTKVVQDKYYRKVDFIYAHCKTRAFMIWQNILWS